MCFSGSSTKRLDFDLVEGTNFSFGPSNVSLAQGNGKRVRQRKYLTREAARRDVFRHIELFRNSKRKLMNNGILSPIHFEERKFTLESAVV